MAAPRSGSAPPVPGIEHPGRPRGDELAAGRRSRRVLGGRTSPAAELRVVGGAGQRGRLDLPHALGTGRCAASTFLQGWCGNESRCGGAVAGCVPMVLPGADVGRADVGCVCGPGLEPYAAELSRLSLSTA